MQRIKGSSETSIYIIDTQYHIVHFNQALARVFPELQCGDICYDVLCGEDMPCKGCPLTAEEKDSTIFYNKSVRQWLEVSTGLIDWPGAGRCNIILCKEIYEGNKNLFYNLADVSAYDELFELNLTQNTYRILYHQKGKYIVPAEEGNLKEMIQECAKTQLIHPDDSEAFLQFWDLDRLNRLFEDYNGNDPIYGQFRKHRVTGEYSWVVQRVVPLKENASQEKIFLCFIQDIHDQKLAELEVLRKAEIQQNSTDRLTGLLKRREFYKKSQEFLKERENEKYCLMTIDIEHFKLFNAWYGQKAGDKCLKHIAGYLKKAEEEYYGIAGYMGDDDFAMILPDNDEMLKNLQDAIVGYVRRYGGNAGFLPAFGIYEVTYPMTTISNMYDRAAIAMASVKGNYATRVCRYDSSMMQDMEKNHVLLLEVQRALENDEFTFYCQPKCNMSTGKIIGLESLVRWQHPQRGLILPKEFIPMLEENGFITNLDLYIWESVCKQLRDWIDHGHHPIPISVNVSRIDIYTIDVAQCFKNLIKKYQLKPSLLEIEITESAYVEEYQLITKAVEELQSAGFTVLMDDFGSGYSSLNMLKDIKVNILKIDMKFLEFSGQSAGRGLGILEAIVSMARLMNLRMIAEGIETKEQMDFLLDMGCYYGQGYYFYRPMSIKDMKVLLADENNVDFRGIKARQLERVRTKELLNEDVFSETVINNILGGVAFYEVHEKEVSLVRANEQYYKVTGTNPMDLEERKENMLESIYEEDWSKTLEIFKCSKKNSINGAEGDIRRVRDDGRVMWMHLKAFFLGEKNGIAMYYGSVSDITELKDREHKLEASQKALASIVNISEKDESFMRLTEENRRAAAAIFAQMTPGGMIGGYCEEGFPLYFANYEMVKLMGYENYEEMQEAIGGLVLNTIHPDDREHVAKDIGSEYYAGLEYTTVYRMPKKDGTWFWTLDKGKVVEAEDGRLAIVSACTDITESVIIHQRLNERNLKLQKQNQELNFINRDMPGGYYRCGRGPAYKFLYISPRFLEIFGYTEAEIKELFDNKFSNMIHPDDKKRIIAEAEHVIENGRVQNLEYRMMSKHGYIWVIDQSRHLEFRGNVFLQGVVLEITNMVKLRNKMKLLMEHTPENIFILTFKDGHWTYEMIAGGLFQKLGEWNDEFKNILSNKWADAIICQEGSQRLDENIKEIVKERKNYHSAAKVLLKEGKAFWINIDIRYIREDTEGIVYLCLCSDITDMKQKENELMMAGKKMECILRHAGINSWEWDIQRHLLKISNVVTNEELASAYEIMAEKETVIENYPEHMLQNLDCDLNKEFREFLDKMKHGEGRQSFSLEIPVKINDKKTIWLQTVAETICNEKGEVVKAVGYYRDITKEKIEEMKQIESMKALEILRKQALYDFKVNLTKDSISFDKQGELWLKETRCKKDWFFSEDIAYLEKNIVLPEFKKAYKRFLDRERLIQLYYDGTKTDSLDYQRFYHGQRKWLRLIIHLVKFDGMSDVFGYLFIMDIDEQKKQELYLTKMAETDALTGLYNRHAAQGRIEQFLMENPGHKAALIMFDLDNFKLANDVFGHAYGDYMIAQNAEKLKNFFRQEDIICRIGGDEFMVLCKGIEEADVEKKLQGIIKSMEINYKDGKQEIIFSISAGYAIIPEDGNNFLNLYEKADIALFSAKMSGKSAYRKYDNSMKTVRYELAD